MDALHLERPFAGARLLRDLLRREGHAVGHVGTLMTRMGIAALHRKPNTCRKHPRHPVHPYRLRGLVITRPNQVWAMDWTSPTSRSGRHHRLVQSTHAAHRVSISMDVDFCL